MGRGRAIALGLIVSLGLFGCTAAPTSSEKAHPQASKPVQEARVAVASEPPASPKSSVAAVTDQYVITEVAEERLGPDASATVTNKVYRGQAVKVYETTNGWARVSEYYEGRVEGRSGRIARWIASAALANERPAVAKALNIPPDPRIHLTRVPGGGLNERDVLTLHAAARYFLETGRAKGIEDGDKSLSKPGTYYLNFSGETQNTFFRPSDIPDLDRRIQELMQ